MQYTKTGDFTGSLWSPGYTVAQVIYNYSIVNLIKSYPHDTLTTCNCDFDCKDSANVHSVKVKLKMKLA
jgi:hypothetical protein